MLGFAMARLRALWGSLLARWRSWSVRRQLAVAGVVVLVCGGGIVGAYLILKRPGDIHNPGAAFKGKEKELEEK